MANATLVELSVTCSACGEPIESVPTWLIGASVKFECDRCRQKKAKDIADLETEPRRAPRKPARPEPVPDEDLVEEPDDEEAEDLSLDAEAEPESIPDEVIESDLAEEDSDAV
ncbi:MAG: hypothetical protein GX446_09310 [Chthonomonadales bacterium]|nr:hypothetical protein [Chthonomonadales bacterium]